MIYVTRPTSWFVSNCVWFSMVQGAWYKVYNLHMNHNRGKINNEVKFWRLNSSFFLLTRYCNSEVHENKYINLTQIKHWVNCEFHKNILWSILLKPNFDQRVGKFRKRGCSLENEYDEREKVYVIRDLS